MRGQQALSVLEDFSSSSVADTADGFMIVAQAYASIFGSAQLEKKVGQRDEEAVRSGLPAVTAESGPGHRHKVKVAKSHED